MNTILKILTGTMLPILILTVTIGFAHRYDRAYAGFVAAAIQDPQDPQDPPPPQPEIPPVGGCQVSLDPVGQDFTTAGGVGAIFVGTNCSYSVVSDSLWVSIRPACGGTIYYSVERGCSREATLSVTGVDGSTATFSVRQQ